MPPLPNSSRSSHCALLKPKAADNDNRNDREFSRAGEQYRPLGRIRAPWLAATSLSVLKPFLQKSLRPVSRTLRNLGFTANLVTLVALLGSVLVGVMLAINSSRTVLFALLPVWLLIRTCLNTIDGTLAIEFGQKSRLGAVLNEAGDVLSDISLYAPFMLIPPFESSWTVAVITLSITSELVGVVSLWLGTGRRVEGPFGKTDRALVFGGVGIGISVVGALPPACSFLMALFAALAILTIANRVRFALKQRKTRTV